MIWSHQSTNKQKTWLKTLTIERCCCLILFVFFLVICLWWKFDIQNVIGLWKSLNHPSNGNNNNRNKELITCLLCHTPLWEWKKRRKKTQSPENREWKKANIELVFFSHSTTSFSAHFLLSRFGLRNHLTLLLISEPTRCPCIWYFVMCVAMSPSINTILKHNFRWNVFAFHFQTKKKAVFGWWTVCLAMCVYLYTV